MELVRMKGVDPIATPFLCPESEHDEMNDLANKRQVSCDEVLATYLVHVAKKVNKDYYVVLLKLVLLYRECFNSLATRLSEEKKKLAQILILQLHHGPVLQNAEYSMVNNAEQLPDVSNEFMTNYLPKSGLGLCFEEAKGFVLNLNYWLFHNRYTCSTISLVEGKTI